jgi:hypothetical protein
MIQIGQFYRDAESGPKRHPKYRPTVKFRKLDTTTLKMVQELEKEAESDTESDDDDDDVSLNGDDSESEDRDFEFDVDVAIDLSGVLQDLLDPEDKGVDAMEAPQAPPAAPAAEKTSLKDVDWKNLRKRTPLGAAN